MHVTVVLGSPGRHSKSTALAAHLGAQLEQRGVALRHYSLEQFEAADLLGANFKAPSVQRYLEDIRLAAGVIVATPVYKASISGLLKTLLDLIPEGGLEHKSVLGVATGGSKAHMLAVDHALQPILINLKAGKVLPTVFASDDACQRDDHGYSLAPEIIERLDLALERFHDTLESHPDHPMVKERSHRWFQKTLAT